LAASDLLTDLIEVPGGTFSMGSDHFYPDEGPVHFERVMDLGVERHPVTNAQFAAFVAEKGHVTVAERHLDPALYPGVAPEDLVPGALVFRPTQEPVDLRDWRQWWDWASGANWRQPYGPGSDLTGMDDHPVVQVAYADAQAYATWAGRRLPTEAEWEQAAGGGVTTTYAWGDEERPDGTLMANTWQGRFPYFNTGAKGWIGTSPVGTFPPNAFGLVDMIGNVWEWTTTTYAGRHQPAAPCCGGGRPDRLDDPTIRMALKGGSHLCAPEYCLRYRPPARSPQSLDTSTTHIGFRCVVDA
jgi:formylglycine-generating enzyme